MYLFIISAFILGYLLIALENPLKIDKAAIAIVTGVFCWVILTIGQDIFFSGHVEGDFVTESLLHHVGEISEILFFLMAAMTIVELIDAHNGFKVITNLITTTNKIKLIWILCGVAFFFSALLDNLTTSIVMAAILRKLFSSKEDLWFFAGMVIIAANAGGAWSPIGDVSTIMLWISDRVSALNIVTQIFIPSLICLLIPLLVVSCWLKGEIASPAKVNDQINKNGTSSFEQNLIFWMGILGLLSVPFFKHITGLPPFMGMMFSLGILWVTTELIHRDKNLEHKSALSVAGVIQRIDTPSILFFLGILMAVASLQTTGVLGRLATVIDNNFDSVYIINALIGLLSAIIDNIPLVAGAIGMYPLSVYPKDHLFWELLAFCAGTGGSIIIIGSAAGVAMMGILKIDFGWYIKRISWLALIGYLAGIGTYWLLNS